MKNHRDFVIYVRNGVEINALVVFSQDVFTPATQTVPESHIEHLTLVYLEPGSISGIPTGDAIRSGIKTQFGVAPISENSVNGWKDVLSSKDPDVIAAALEKSSGLDGDAGDWTTAGRDERGFPVMKGSPTDITAPVPVVGLPTQEEADAIMRESAPTSDPTVAAIVPEIPAEDIVQPDPEVIAAAPVVDVLPVPGAHLNAEGELIKDGTEPNFGAGVGQHETVAPVVETEAPKVETLAE